MKNQSNNKNRQLGLKMSGDAYEELERRANLRSMTPTSLARWYVLDELKMSDQFAKRRTGKRKPVVPLTRETKLKIALLRELQLIRLNLELIQRGEAEQFCGQRERDLAEALEGAKQTFRSLLVKPVGQGA